MTVVEYLRHLSVWREERIKRRVAVLICLQNINEARIKRVEEEVKRGKLNSGEGNNNDDDDDDVVVMNNVPVHQPQIRDVLWDSGRAQPCRVNAYQ